MVKEETMLLISMTGFIVLIVFAVLSLVSMGFCGWYYFMNELSNSASQNKIIAENIFFLAIIEILIFLVILFSVSVAAKQRRKKLEKISELNNITGNLRLEQFNFLKNLGTSIFSLYSETSNLSELRAKKIKLQNNVIHEIMQTIEQPVFLLNVKGVVIEANQAFLEGSKEKSSLIVGSEIGDLFNDFDFTKSLKSIVETKASLKVVLGGIDTELFPVFDNENEIGGIIGKLKKATSFSLDSKIKNVEKKGKNTLNFFKNLNSSLFHK